MDVLYRKYRPQNFDQIVGQNQVTDILKLAIEKDRISHGYLLVGPRGVGKTSVARILAHAINDTPYDLNQNDIDIIEIDGASNNSVENIREIISKSHIAPSKSKKKIYIIDEVHMLSKGAFNAFLKILEEPPKHLVFILATTDEHKIPETIISRTQRFVFKKIKDQAIVNQLKYIAEQEKFDLPEEGYNLIAKSSDGGLRDAINLLDQIASLSGQKIELDLIESITGSIKHDLLEEIYKNYENQDIIKINENLNNLFNQNYQANEIAKQLILYITDKKLEDIKSLELMSELMQVAKSEIPETQLLLALAKKETKWANLKAEK